MTDSSHTASIKERTSVFQIVSNNRYLIARRFVQVGTLLLFAAGAWWDWSILKGNLSASRLFERIFLADPFATLQIYAAGQSLAKPILLGAATVLLFYLIVGGRVFCSWVCPVNMVTDLAAWLRNKLNIKTAYQLNRNLRYLNLGLALVLSAISGYAAFEWVSPINMMHRELIFGLGMGWTAVLGLFFFDLLLVRHGWCGHLCPLGAFYSLLGRLRVWKIQFQADRCDKCGVCHKICPEPHVLKLTDLNQNGRVIAGDCTNCLRCTSVCPQKALHSSLSSPLESFKLINQKEVV